MSPKSAEGSSRPTIGLFIMDLTQSWTIPQWRGVSDGARRRGANLICFPGGLIRARFGNDAQANILYDLARGNRVDGLVIWTAGLDSYLTEATVQEFASLYRPIPIVSAEHSIVGCPSVVMDDYGAMLDIMSHLVEVHGFRRIAFIQSNATAHTGILDRYRAYQDSLSRYGIAFDPSLVSPPFNFEERKNHPTLNDWILRLHDGGKAAIVGFNDLAAVATLEAIKTLGLAVPDDFALTGFDDIEESGAATPPITTVHPPFYELGLEAADAVLDLLEGKSVPDKTLSRAKLEIRRSCGCEDPAVLGAAAGASPREGGKSGGLASQKSRILDAMATSVGARSIESLGALLADFIAELAGEVQGVFVQALERAMREDQAVGSPLSAWQDAISTMRRMSINCLEAEELRAAENLWQQARVSIAAAACRQETARGHDGATRIDILREIQSDLTAAFGLGEIMRVLAERLPQLGIVGCFLSLYEDPEPYDYPRPAPTSSRLMLAFDAEGRSDLGPEGLSFPSRLLTPEGFWPETGPFSFVAEALFFRSRQLGFALFAVDSRQGPVYEMLRGLISSSLESALLLQNEARAERDLKQERNLLRTLIDQIPDFIYVKDRGSRFMLLNDAARSSIEAINGLQPPGEIIGKTDLDFFDPAKAAEYFADERKVVENGEAILNREELSATTAGDTNWVLTSKVPLRDDRGEIIGLVGVSRDITERKRAEEALELQSARLGMALEVAGTITASLDVEEILRRVVTLIREKFGYYSVSAFLLEDSGAWAELRAISGDIAEARGGNIRLAVGGDSMIGWSSAQGRPCIAQDVSADPSYKLHAPLTRSEAVLPMLVGGETIGVLDVQSDKAGVFNDDAVTVLKTMAYQIAIAVQNARLHAAEKQRTRELRSAYEALQENQERTLIAEKMASLGRLTAGIAHELNTLIAALRASLVEIDRLADEYASSIEDTRVTAKDHGEIAAEMKASLRLATKASERAAGFISGIKTQTRAGKADFRKFDAIPVIEEALLLLGHSLRKANCELRFQPELSRANLFGSAGRLAQIVTNLVTNAIDASSGKGRGSIAISLAAQGGSLELRVSDEGAGIARENLSKIFEPLFTTKPIGEGTGLGLTIVHDIVVGEFGGSIDVETEIGRGSSFVVRLPTPQS